MKSTEFNEEGKPQIEIFSETEHVIQTDTIIFATGQTLDRTIIEHSGIEINKRGAVKASSETLDQP